MQAPSETVSPYKLSRLSGMNLDLMNKIQIDRERFQVRKILAKLNNLIPTRMLQLAIITGAFEMCVIDTD